MGKISIIFLLFITNFNLSINNCKAQTVTKINFDSLQVITPGEMGVPLPKTIQAGKPTVTLNSLASIPAGKPKIVEINHNELKIKSPGINGVPMPKRFLIPDSGYNVQYGDTIYALKSVIAKQPIPISAQRPQYKDAAVYDIQFLDVDQGLPVSYIYTIYEDKRGNLWIGTYGGGVSRYDGKYFTTFTHKDGLADNYIYTIAEDKSGNLWFGTWGGGVSRYDGKSFTSFTVKEGLASNVVFSILDDKKGNIWFGTNGAGVSRYDGKSFTSFTEKEGLANNKVRSIALDKTGNIWFGTDGGGVSCYDGKSFTSFTEKEGLANNQIRSILVDKSGNLWFGTWGGGVSRYDGKTFTSFSDKEGLVHNRIRSIAEDKEGKLWFGGYLGGVSIYDGKSFTSITVNEGLPSNEIISVTEDNSGNIWIGTYGGGICRYNMKSFISITEKDGLSNNRVRSIAEDKNGNLWFGTFGSGVSCYDGKSFSSFTKNEGLTNNYVYSIVEDNSGNLWFATFGGGVNCFDGKSFTAYTEKEGLVSNNVNCITIDKNGNIWFGTESGVSIYDGKSFFSITQKDGLVDSRIRSIIQVKSGDFWIGTGGGGICRLTLSGVEWNNSKQVDATKKEENISQKAINRNKKKLKHHTNGTISFTSFTKKEGLANNYVYNIFEDQSGNIWVGTDGGISVLKNNLIANDDLVFTNFTTDDGLTHNMVLSFAEDSDNRLWIGTEGGILMLSMPNGELDWSDINFHSYLKADGLRGLDAVINSVCIDNFNRIWWGMGKGITMLDLKNFELPTETPKIQFDGLYINESFIDYRLLLDSLHNKKNVKDSKFGDIRFKDVAEFYNYPLNLDLPHYLNHLLFNFSAIDWENPHKVEYQYILEGLDKVWNKRTKETRAEYRNIPPGKFTFKVKAIGAANKWSETFEYEFKVLPPWWHTWWAYTIYSIVAIALVLLIVKLNTRRLIQQKTQLEQAVKERTTKIVKQKEEIETQAIELKSTNLKLVELDEFKQGMTSMIVHDLKNPLNGIINISKSYSTENQNYRIKQKGKQMLNMVLNILDVLKYEESKMIVEKLDHSLFEISHNAISRIVFLAEQKNISIENKIPHEIRIKSDKEIIERVFVNILTNAIKYTSNNGYIGLLIDKNSKDGFVKIEISDTGQGIPAEQIQKVFDKFGQISAKKSGSVQSTGLGLTFCKMAIEAHGGKIGVVSKEGKGTSFWFILQDTRRVHIQDNETDTLPSIPNLKLMLSENDKKIIKPYTLQFKGCKIYEISALRNILRQIDPNENEAVILWKEEMNKAIRSGNEKKYCELIDNILEK